MMAPLSQPVIAVLVAQALDRGERCSDTVQEAIRRALADAEERQKQLAEKPSRALPDNLKDW